MSDTEKLTDPRIAFFDSIADVWDGWHDLDAQVKRLRDCFSRFGVRPGETVLDVGCGTGNLTQALLDWIGSDGHVVAIDSSDVMLEHAKRKIDDPRASWIQAAAARLPVGDAVCDRVICFSSWPHFETPQTVIREFRRVLKPGGYVHILHFLSRGEVNRIHGGAHPSVRADRLAPVSEVAGLFEKGGFAVGESVDDACGYLLTVRKNT